MAHVVRHIIWCGYPRICLFSWIEAHLFPHLYGLCAWQSAALLAGPKQVAETLSTLRFGTRALPRYDETRWHMVCLCCLCCLCCLRCLCCLCCLCFLFVCLFVCLLVCLSVCLLVCLFVCVCQSWGAAKRSVLPFCMFSVVSVLASNNHFDGGISSLDVSNIGSQNNFAVFRFSFGFPGTSQVCLRGGWFQPRVRFLQSKRCPPHHGLFVVGTGVPQYGLGPPVPFDPLLAEGSPTKIDYRKKGTLILASLLEDLVLVCLLVCLRNHETGVSSEKDTPMCLFWPEITHVMLAKRMHALHAQGPTQVRVGALLRHVQHNIGPFVARGALGSPR